MRTKALSGTRKKRAPLKLVVQDSSRIQGLKITLIDFIIKAKLSGYAGSGEGQELKFNDGSKGFEFLSGDYRYLDRYNGFNPFSGSERVFDSDNNLVGS